MNQNQNNVIEIDLLALAKAVWMRIWAVVLAALIGGGAILAYTVLCVSPTYKSDCLFYVNNNNISLGSTSVTFSSSQLTAAQSLVSTYQVILKSRNTLNEVIEQADLNYSYAGLSGMISSTAVDDTEIFRVTVTSGSPTEAEYIANTIAKVLPDKIAEIVEGSSVRIVDYAVVPSSRSSPSYTKNTAIGLVLGAVVAVAFIVLRELFDSTVRNEQLLTTNFPDVPILATIPDMSFSGKGRYGYGKYKYGYGKYGYGYGYGRYGKYGKYGDNRYAEASVKKTSDREENNDGSK